MNLPGGHWHRSFYSFGLPVPLKWSQDPYPGRTRPSKLPWGCEASREKTLELEFSPDLATWSMSPADASVSGCSAGAPRECGTKRALRIPYHYAALTSRGPGHCLPVAFLALAPLGDRWESHGWGGAREEVSGEGGCPFAGLRAPGITVLQDELRGRFDLGGPDGSIRSQEGGWAAEGLLPRPLGAPWDRDRGTQP